MLFVVQFPFADARRFVPNHTNRLLTPAWPVAIPGRDFVRSFGGLEKRNRGGVEEWTAEDIYCRAKHPVRFYPPLTKVPFETASVSVELKCAFRRLLYDGEALIRVEYGFRVDKKERDRFIALDGKSLLDFVSYGLARPVRISSPNPNAAPNSCELIQSRSHIAKHYLEATTRRLKGSAPFSPETWWVTELTPLILIEHSWAEISSFPKYTRPVAAITEQIDSKISLWYCPVKYMGQQLGLWCLGYDQGANRDVIRRLRIHLLRLHAERECLKQILRYLAINRIDTRSRDQESDSLQLYLTNSIRLLTRASRYGLPQSQILLAAQNADDFVTEGERTNLLTAVERVRRNLYRAVKQFTEQHGPHETIFYNISGNGAVNIGRTIHTGEEHVTKYNIKFGDRTVFHGDFVVANAIQNSFNKIDPSGASPKLKEQLKNLHENVTEMTQHMEPSKGKEAARDLQSFTEEVTSEAPRQKWYSVSAEGLLDAAKAVGSIAAPVVSTVKTILALLSGAA